MRRALLPVVAVWCGCGVSAALEPEERVLESLRDRGHEALALEFLEYCERDPLVSEAFRARISAERLRSQLAIAKRLDSAEERAAAIDRATESLERLAQESGGDPGALAEAAGQLAIAAADESRRLALAATALPESAARDKQLREARSAMDAARRRLGGAEQRFEEAVERLKAAPADSPAGRERLALKQQLAQVRLIAARLIHEEGLTHPDGSQEAARLHKQAGEQLAALYEKYSKFLIGLYAHLYEGRCYQRLGQTSLAAACFEDLTAQPANDRNLRRVATLAHADLASLWLADDKPDKSLDQPAAWLERLPASERRGPEAARLKYWLGEAGIAAADALSGNDSAKRRLLVEARDRLAESATLATDVQVDARQAWAKAMSALGAEPAQLENFDQALAAGKEAIATIGAMRLAAQATGADPAATEELQQQEGAARGDAVRAFEEALRLADDKTPKEELNEARYLLAWLLWESGAAERAAELCERVALDGPEAPTAEDAARLALAALERLARSGDNEGAGDRLRDFARFVLDQWPAESDAAQTATTVLLNRAIESGRLEEAEVIVRSASPERRPALLLRFAVARWERAESSERNEVGKLLGTAYSKACEGGGSQPATLATAALYYSQFLLTSQPNLLLLRDDEYVLQMLAEPTHGPLTLVAKGLPPADTALFRREAFRLEAWARAALCQDYGPALLRFKEELATLSNEEAFRAGLSLAVALRTDLTERREWNSSLTATDLAKAKDPSVPEGCLSGALRDVLLVLIEWLNNNTPDVADWNTSVWIGQSMTKLAEESDQQARELYTAAGELFERLVERAERNPDYAPKPEALLAARLQSAQCALRVDQHDRAYSAMVELLRERPSMLDVQRDAALALQRWGKSEGDPERLEQSIAGAVPGDDGKHVVWGWSKIAAVAGGAAARDPKYNERFFEAWLNVARSRYLAAMLAQGSEREEQLRKAVGTIRAMRRQYPDLGGPESTAAFDSLLREVQTALGERPRGLAAIAPDNGTGG